VRIVNHDCAGLAVQDGEHGIDRTGGVVPERRHCGGRIGQTDAADRVVQTRDQQASRDATFLKQDPDRQRTPRVDHLGTEDRLAIPASRLDDDDSRVGTASRQPWTADMKRR
jgi:hypothetical protein